MWLIKELKVKEHLAMFLGLLSVVTGTETTDITGSSAQEGK
ncbi:hypothetical protein [Anaerosporomusa subterranea]|nr:hypothetical protein [Anaerosporomusa subterranea]